jgi:hypothetical protein
MLGAQIKWYIEELGEFYEAVDNYNRKKGLIEDVAERTLGLFHMAQMFPAVEPLLEEHIKYLYMAISSFQYKEQYYQFRKRKLEEQYWQAKELTIWNAWGLYTYINNCCFNWYISKEVKYATGV